MLGLPKSTEVAKQLPKKAIYAKFQMNHAEKEKFDADISKIYIANEISPMTIHIAKGENVASIYLLQVVLKRKQFTEKTLVTLTKLIDQNMILLLEYEDECKLAVFRTKLLPSPWQPKEKCTIQLKGLDLDSVWENLIIQIGDITVQQDHTLDEQIATDDRAEKLKKEIAKLESKIRKEKQLNRQMKLNCELKKLKKELEVLSC